MRVVVSQSAAFDGPLAIFEPPCAGAYPYEVDVTEDTLSPIKVWVVDLNTVEELFEFISTINCARLMKFKWNKSYFHIQIMDPEEEF